MDIRFESQPSADFTGFLTNGINSQAKEAKGLEPAETFGFAVYEPNGHLKGGLFGVIYYGCLDIKTFYLDKDIRGQGLGRLIIEKTEDLARSKSLFFNYLSLLNHL